MSNWKQIRIECIDNLEKVKSYINWLEDYPYIGEYDLYKSSNDDNLYLDRVTNFVGDLGTVEKTTKKDLKERFDYELRIVNNIKYYFLIIII